MRTCPYCLYRFPDDASGCPRCANTLAVLSKGAMAQAAHAPTAWRSPGSFGQWLPFVLGGVVVLAVLAVAIVVGPRLLGGGPPPSEPASSAPFDPNVQATAMAAFPTPAPPSGWREWLVAGNRLRLWLPQTYQAVNFTDANWQAVYSATLTQDSFLRSQAAKVKAETIRETLLAGVSARSDPYPVRVMVISAPALAGSDRPELQDVQPFVDKLGIGGQVKNTRNLAACGIMQMTQMAVIPPKLDDPNAWRGFVLAATSQNDGYLMFALVKPRDFSNASDMLNKVLDSLCGLPSGFWHTPTPSPTPTLTPIPPTPTPTSTATVALNWAEWKVQDKLKLVLPKAYNVVNFTDKDWQRVYSATLALDSYLRDEANRVKSGASKNTWLMATSPSSDTIAVRVILIGAPQLAGAGRPTTAAVQAITEKLGIKGKLSKASPLEDCGLMLTRMELVPPAASQWGGSVLAATDSKQGYVLITLISPQQVTDRAVLDKILGSLCALSP